MSDTIDELELDQEEQDERPFTPLVPLVGVIIRPRNTFQRMREAERGHWWLVLVLALLSLILVTAAIVPIQARATRGALAAQQEDMELSPEEQAQMRQVEGVMTSQATLGAMTFGFSAIGTLIGYLIRGGILYLLGMVLGGRANFKQVFRMAVWTTFPNIIRSIVSALAIFSTGEVSASGLAYIFTSTETTGMSPILLAFLGGIDFYLLWGLVLIGIGMVATAKLNNAKGSLATIIYWLVTTGATLGWAALMQSLGNALSFS